MNQNRLVTAIALLIACPLFAAESGSKVGPTGDKTSPPVHVIQPVDIIEIEMVKVIPVPPYRAEVFDVLQIRATTPPDAPIDNYYMIEAEGTVNLGPPYGSVHVSGLTKEETVMAIDERLRKTISKPNVSVTIARVAGAQPVTGQYLVGPDGTINLRQYGVVGIGGKTIADAKATIEKHLANFLDSPRISIEVVADKSKVCYVIANCADLGENVWRVPLTGKETVLDAITRIGGLRRVSDKKLWIARPLPKNSGCVQILSINWDGIIRGTSTATNYQLLPGDQLYVADDELATFAKVVSKVTTGNEVQPATITQAAPATAAPASTALRQQPTGRGYNPNRNGL